MNTSLLIYRLVVLACALVVASLAFAVLPEQAAAAAVSSPRWNSAPPASSGSNNCVAWYSSSVTHNGTSHTLGQGGHPDFTRREEMRWLQASCNEAGSAGHDEDRTTGFSAASSDQGPTVALNPSGQPATASDNCIAIYSAAVTHNGASATLGQGGDPSTTRRSEMRWLQEFCNRAGASATQRVEVYR